MAQELIRDGKLDRQAAAEALRHFLENIVHVSGLELNVNVRPVATDGVGPGDGAEVLADLDGKDKGTARTKGFSWNATRKFCKRSSIWPSGRCGWNLPSTKKSTSIAGATARCVLKNCA